MNIIGHARMRHLLRQGGTRQQQRGAATLIVVALLFFVVSLVAAYTNRNLIFEQRTSANQLRSTLAFEAADAGVEWAVAMLNAGRIDASCEPVDDATATSFRDRYLDVDPDTGLVQPRANMAAGSLPTCENQGGEWECSCPVTGAPAVSGTSPDPVAPAFRLRFVQRPANRPGTIWIEVQACTRLDDGCLSFGAVNAQAGEGRARTAALLALRSALPSPPVAALAVRGDVDMNGDPVRLVNAFQGAGSSLALQAGGALTDAGALALTGAAGEIVSMQTQVLVPDPSLAAAVVPDGERLFGSVFGIQSAVYRDQPASLVLDCENTCDADTLRAVLQRNPGRVLWAAGDVNLDGGAPLGSATEPVLLIVEGDLTSSDIEINGLVYSNQLDWTFASSNTSLRGALMAGNNLALTGNLEVIRDASTLNLLRWRHGSYVRVPGGWSDY